MAELGLLSGHLLFQLLYACLLRFYKKLFKQMATKHLEEKVVTLGAKMCWVDLSSEGCFTQSLGVPLADSLHLSTLQGPTQPQRATMAKVMPLFSKPILEHRLM